MRQCPKCECSFLGAKCACGYQVPGALAIGSQGSGRRWKLCEWGHAGRTCNVPTGTLGAEGATGPLRPPRFCAYHRERERMSLYGAYTSEQTAFLTWVEQFPPGTSYQPSPRIWDLDRAMLWLLVSGEMSWEAFQTWAKGPKVSA